VGGAAAAAPPRRGARPPPAPGPGPPPGAPLTAFDPRADGGDASERDEDLTNLLDGDPGSTWRTEQYNDRELGRLKNGVGFFVQLPESTDIRSVGLESHSTDWNMQIYVSDDGSDVTIEDWGDPVAEQEGITPGEVIVDLDEPVTGRYVLVYITYLGTETDNAGRSFVELSDLTVLE
jgi:hypothetical protein